MKLHTSLCLATALLIPSLAQAETSTNDIPYGFVVTTSYRSEYIYRGIELSEGWLDVQFQGEVAFNDTSSVHFGTWYGSETGEGDFSETGFFSDFTFSHEKYEYGVSFTYRDFNNIDLDSGFDAGLFASYHITDRFSLNSGINYDFGAEGIYAHLEGAGYYVINRDAYLSFKLGISAVDSYYDRDGLNDVYSRVSLTFDINDTISISPFLGTSIQLDSAHGDDSFHGGLWFEVSF